MIMFGSFLPSLFGWLSHHQTLLGPGSRHCYGIITLIAPRPVMLVMDSSEQSGLPFGGNDAIAHNTRKDCFRVGHFPMVRWDGAAESRFAHSCSPCGEGNHRRHLHSVPHRDPDCPSDLL